MVGSAHLEPLHSKILRQCRRTPHHIAIVEPSRRVSYSELAGQITLLADRFTAAGVRPHNRIALMMEKSADSVAAIFAILTIGATYVPVDTLNPPHRVASTLRAIAPTWLCTDSENEINVRRCAADLPRDLISGLLSASASDVPTLVPAGDTVRASISDRQAMDADISPAVILFTSGSSGDPKGVPLSNRDLTHFVVWSHSHFGTQIGDRLSLHPPLTFDAALWDITRALMCGAQLHIVPSHANLLPTGIRDFILNSRLTQWDSVPGVLSSLASRDILMPGDFPDLRRVISYGDVLPRATLSYWMKRLPHVRFTNTYGPTEITVTASYHDIVTAPEPHTDSIPIGVPVPGKCMMVLDRDGQPASPNTIGELAIGGMGVSTGYWRDARKTCESFVFIPPKSDQRWYLSGDLASVDTNGVFHFHGRRDRQVKSRGRRIELDEIAVALNAIPEIYEHAVVGIDVGGIEGTRICCAFTPRDEETPGIGNLREQLSEFLPSYMHPQFWQPVSAIPRNRNGKIDHRAVQLLFEKLGR